MPTWEKSTGSSGTMRIVDTGSVVEFWLNANSTTTAHNLGWRFYYNGSWSSYRDFDFSGGAFRKLGVITVSTEQTVGFGIEDSGTNGLGGPTNFTVAIDRATVPPAPTMGISNVSATYIDVNSNSNGNGGATVDQWQLGWGTNPNGPTSYKFLDINDGTGTVNGLTKGTTYYFWARRHNSEGWGRWSSRASATTWKEPAAPSAVVISNITQRAVTTKFTGNSAGGTPILEWQLAYGTSPSAPQTAVPSTGTLNLTGLSAGMKYYFWARGRNAVGWGPYSPVSTATLLAGARIMYANVWKNAVPYVKVSGAWKIAEPWAKIAGLWKRTS